MAPLVAFPLLIAGMAVLVGAALGIAALLPRVRIGKWSRRLISAGLFITAMPVVIWSSMWASNAAVIVLAYGYDAYAGGLWIVNKHGDLSDGSRLSDIWHGVWGAFMFLSFAWPLLPLMVFRFVSDRPEERDADSGEAYFWRGKVRLAHGAHAQALSDFQLAIVQLESFLEYAGRKLPAEPGDAERIERARDCLQQAREGIVQCERSSNV